MRFDIMRGCGGMGEAVGEAVLVVLYIGAIRRAELSGLDVADWAPESLTLRRRSDERDEAFLVPLVGAAARALDDWLAVRGDRRAGSSWRSPGTTRSLAPA